MLKKVLVPFFKELNANKIDFAVIGNYHDLPDYTSNDVDLWVSSVAKAERVLYEITKQNNYSLYLRNGTANGSNNYFYNSEKGISLVKIDLMKETAWHSIIPIVEPKIIKKNIIEYKDFPVVNESLETVMHLIYPLLTFGIVKDKYKAKFVKYTTDEAFVSVLNSIVGGEKSKTLIEYINQNDWKGIVELRGRIKSYLIKKSLIKLFSIKRLVILFLHLLNIIKRLISTNGAFISFTGLDGAGKTTIKEEILKDSDRFFLKGKSVQYYWRPFFFPRVAALAGKKQLKNEEYDDSGRRVVSVSLKSQMFSLVKFLYYSLDFFLGKIKFLRQLKTGGLILFDRYYFDNVIYPERFGFNVSKYFMRVVDRLLIPQPDIIFYFTAETVRLHLRKEELSIEEITAQKELYADEIKRKKNVVVIDNTDSSIEDTKSEVLLHVLSKMSTRYKVNG